MKTITLTGKQYRGLLDFKNYVSVRTRQITNPEILEHMVDMGDPDYKEKMKKPHGIPSKAWSTIDFEPEYSFGECVDDAIGCIWNEQERGEVNYIT